jgi:hypothetical protein
MERRKFNSSYNLHLGRLGEEGHTVSQEGARKSLWTMCMESIFEYFLINILKLQNITNKMLDVEN